MRLSVRARVLAAYGVLLALFVVVLFTGFTRLRRIGDNLNMIQSGYLPFVRTVNTFFNLFHLNESFDVERIIENRSNRLFLESISIHNPRLLESSLQKSLAEARKAVEKNPSWPEYRALDRIAKLIDRISEPNKKYQDLLSKVSALVRAGNLKEARAQNQKLMSLKRIIRTRINELSRRVDDRIRGLINGTVREERNAVLLTLTLSVVTLILALFLGLIAIFSLRPLALLKKATQEIAAGDLRRRVQIRSKDEVGDLAREFNRMADSIEERDQALRKQQEQLVQSERMAVLGRMASKINHEVRNPLNAMGLNVELLSDEIKDPNLKKSLGAITREIDRLKNIAESYLSLSKRPKQNVEDTNLKDVLDHLATLIEPEAEKKNRKFEKDISENLPMIRSDTRRLEQAILNLLRNAMEAVDAGGTFGIRSRRENGSAIVEVWDQGSGIPEDELPNIFVPFYTTKEKGTGLGLAITEEIIREQGGHLGCESTSGQGSVFSISLPGISRDV